MLLWCQMQPNKLQTKQQENHETVLGHQNSVTLKRVLFEAFDAYVILFVSSCVIILLYINKMRWLKTIHIILLWHAVLGSLWKGYLLTETWISRGIQCWWAMNAFAKSNSSFFRTNSNPLSLIKHTSFRHTSPHLHWVRHAVCSEIFYKRPNL